MTRLLEMIDEFTIDELCRFAENGYSSVGRMERGKIQVAMDKIAWGPAERREGISEADIDRMRTFIRGGESLVVTVRQVPTAFAAE